jgi:outer membrane protein assembly factor BamB
MDEGLTTAPAIIGNTVYVTSTLGDKAYALNAETGGLIWSFQTGGNIYSSPAIANGIAYFGAYDGKLYAVGASNDGGNIAIPDTTYYIIAIVVLIVVIAVGIVVLRKRK